MYLPISKGAPIAELEERRTIDCEVVLGAAFMFITSNSTLITRLFQYCKLHNFDQTYIV